MAVGVAVDADVAFVWVGSKTFAATGLGERTAFVAVWVDS